MNENKHTNTDLGYKYRTHLPITFFCGIEMLGKKCHQTTVKMNTNVKTGTGYI
jgi:hypothetical protein